MSDTKLTALEANRRERLRWVARLLGEPVEDVTLSEHVEPVEPDPRRCGAGKGAACCAFLTAAPEGLQCARHGPLHYTIIDRIPSMNAKRNPEQSYPNCMVHPTEETADA